MGKGVRIFIIEDDDRIRRVSVKRFNQLFFPDHPERFPEYAGRRIRYALIAVSTRDRRPEAVLNAEYSYLQFDAEGTVDQQMLESKAWHAAEANCPLSASTNGVISAGHLFAQERMRAFHTWKPDPDLAVALREAALGRR